MSPLPHETGSRKQSKDIADPSTSSTYNQTSQQEPSPHSIEKRMGLTDHTRGGKTALFRPTINSTKHTYRGTNGSKYKSTKTNNKELNTKIEAEQEAGTSKGGVRPTTNYQCLDKTVRTIDNGLSISYISEPDKTTTFRTIGQPTTTKTKNTTNTNQTPTTRGRTNGRCTGNNTNCTQRCNISTKEDFYREHSSSTCTQEDNGGSHGCYVVVYPLPWPLLVGGVRCSRLWSTSQLLRPSGQQCSHFGGVCPQIQGRQCGAYVGAVEEMMCVVCVDVTEGE